MNEWMSIPISQGAEREELLWERALLFLLVRSGPGPHRGWEVGLTGCAFVAVLGHLRGRAQAPAGLVSVRWRSIRRQNLWPSDQTGLRADLSAARMCVLAGGSLGTGISKIKFLTAFFPFTWRALTAGMPTANLATGSDCPGPLCSGPSRRNSAPILPHFPGCLGLPAADCPLYRPTCLFTLWD